MKTSRNPVLCCVLLTVFGLLSPGFGQVVTFTDGIGDATPRRTDLDVDGNYDPQTQRLPDLLAIDISSFAPDMPHLDRFVGTIDENGGFIRIDVMLDGLINPTGDLDFGDDDDYEPDAYGPHPLVGYIEFDIDQNENTGGETEYARLRYLANAARFGGLPSDTRFAGRAAPFEQEIDSNLNTEPHVERSGEEFHIALVDESPENVQVVVERPNGDPAIFEAGETWWIEGEFFHRAHVYDDFTVSCGSGNDRYEPKLLMRYLHDEASDVTTISLVIPKTNNDAALLVNPSHNGQPNDGCDDNHYSIEEAVIDMIISATVADFFTRQQPGFQLIADWEFQSAAPALDPNNWRVTALLGTAYLPDRVDGEEFIWSDLFPNVIAGDVNGDAIVNEVDQSDINAFIAAFDGTAFYDTDGDDQNGSIDLFNYGPYYCVFDVNYDGVVNGLELAGDALPGDFNLDGIIDGRDIHAFVLALTDSMAYALAYPNADVIELGDINSDGVFDVGDLNGFLVLLLGPQPAPLLGDMNGDTVINLFDIDALTIALTAPAVYQDTFALDMIASGDLNGDLLLDARDIQPFLQLLIAP